MSPTRPANHRASHGGTRTPPPLAKIQTRYGQTTPSASSDVPDLEPEAAPDSVFEAPSSSHNSGLVDQLAGREIASRLRGRYAEITMRIRGADAATRESLMKLAEAMDPDTWDTPEAVLQGVSNADGLFEKLRAALHSSRE